MATKPKTNKPKTAAKAKPTAKRRTSNVPWNKGKKTGIAPWNKGKKTGIAPVNKGTKLNKKTGKFEKSRTKTGK